MKNQNTHFQMQGQGEEADLADIFQLLTQLDKSKVVNQKAQENSNKQQLSVRKYSEVPLSEQSQQQSISINDKYSPMKTHLIRKQHRHHPLRQDSLKVDEQSLNPQSNISNASVYPMEEVLDLPKTTITKSMESALLKSSCESIEGKQKIIKTMKLQILEYQQKYDEAQKKNLQEKMKYKARLRSVLKTSYQNKILYNQYMSQINQSRRIAYQVQFNQKLQPLIKHLKAEQSKGKAKKNKNKNKILSPSDEQDHRLSESLEKEKRPYFSAIASKLEKEKERLAGSIYFENSRKIWKFTEQRERSLKRIDKIQDIQPLCFIEGSCKEIEALLSFDLQKCHQVIISCLRFNPNTSLERRRQIYLSFLQIMSHNKKIKSSTNLLFSQNYSLFIPLSNIFQRDDQILLVNQNNQSYSTFQSFLNRIDINVGQQHIHLIRYIIRICIKGLQEINDGFKYQNYVILPSNLYLNERFELKLENIVFNQILFRQFRHIFSEQDYCYFPPEPQPNRQSISLWSIGILTYWLCFNSKPFQKYQPYSWNNRQEFLLFNQIQFPQKHPNYNPCKQFILLCLNKRSGLNFADICNEGFFIQSK